MKINYYLTYHAVERIQERFGALCMQHPQLKKWKRGDDILAAKDTIDDFVRKAEENKSFINNTNHMVFLYEKYGYDTVFKFLEYKEESMVLIMSQIPNKDVYRLVTVTPTSYRPLVSNVKYNKTDRIEVKKEKELKSWYGTLSPLAQQKLSLSKDEQLDQMLKLAKHERRAVLIEHQPNKSSLYRVVINGKAYTFTTFTGRVDGRNETTIDIQNIEDVNEPDSTPQPPPQPIPVKFKSLNIDPELQHLLDDKLKYALSGGAYRGEAQLVNSNKPGVPSWWRMVIDGIEYEYIRHAKKVRLDIYLLKVTNLFGVLNVSSGNS
jgi:hypothetical protein